MTSHGPLSFERLENRTMLSTSMVTDINTSALSSSPSYIYSIGSTAYFMATDPTTGYELWKSDGTAAGTMLVKDIKPGPTGSIPVGWNSPGYPPYPQFTNVNGTLFFTANDGTTGEELWKSDGTAAGTMMVKDIYAGSTGSAPTGLTNVNGTLFFAANSVGNGIELWKSDGTAAGTVMVKNINFGSGNASPTSLININGTLYFSATDGFNGTELWKSDGTSAGTVMVRDINSGSSSSSPQNLTNYNGSLYFTATDLTNGTELWKSNGTSAGTVLVKDILAGSSSSLPTYLTVSNGSLFFSANDGVNGTELWKSDGTAAGTVLVKDVKPGSDSSFSTLSVWTNLTDVNGTLLFQADDGVNGLELWKSDGTTAGTVMVKDIWPGGSSGLLNPTRIVNNQVCIDGTLFFSAINGTNGYELWKSDGTEAGTQLVSDIFPGPGSYDPVNYSAGSANPAYLANVNGTLFFAASEPTSGTELWKSDGTASGTRLVRDIAGTADSSPASLTDVNGTLFFSAKTVANGKELWKTDGTPAGTVMVKDINPGTGDSSPFQLTNVNGTLFFTASNGINGTELWKSDGTSAGTVMVKDITSGSGSTSLGSLTNVNGTLFFTASTTANGNELWKSDGTDAGTVMVKDIYPGTNGSIPNNLINVNNTLFFTANNGVNGTELWKSDGTNVGTVMVADIRSGTGSSSPIRLTNVNGTLYFTADDFAGNGNELWKSDGTPAGTVLVKDINPGSAGSSPSSLIDVNGTLFFAATDTTNGTELWKSDGTATGTLLVKDILPGTFSSSPWGLTNVDGIVYFTATDTVNGAELWKSDGTAAGTVLIKDINPGSGTSYLQSFVNVSGTLFMLAYDPTTSGAEVWKSDGTAAGTVLVKDIVPGVGSSSPTLLTNVNSTLCFVAQDPFYGWELFRTAIPVASAGGPYNVSPTGSVTLAGSGSVAVGSIASFQWDFDYNPALGFNLSATGPTPTFSGAGLTGPATRTIALRTIDNDGLISNISTTTVNIYENRVVASFVANPSPAAPAQVVAFDASASLQTDPTRAIVNYRWDFGDGTTISGGSPVVNHSYSQFGSFTVSLTVTDDVAQTASTSLSININQGNRAPLAAAGGPYSIAVGQSLALDGSASTDPDTVYGDSIVSYQWDLNNDGLIDVSGVTPSVTWSTLTSLGMTLGDFAASLRVTDTFGVSTIGTASINIFNPAPVIASLIASPSVVNLGGTVTLTANGVTAVAAGATVAKVEFYRDLNANGLIDVGIDKLLGTDTSATSGWTSKPVTTGWAIGANTVLARAQDSFGNWSHAASRIVNINGLPTVGVFVAAPAPALPASPITLTASSVTDPDGTAAAVEIYFDTNKDGKIGSSEPKITVIPDGFGQFVATTTTPAVSGSYKYLARAKDNLGAWGAVKVLTLAVTTPPRIGTLTATPSPVSRGQTLTLTATNVVDDDGTIASVSFYRDADGDGLVTSADKLLGSDTTASDGWSYATASSNKSLVTGVNRILAVAKDNLGAVSAPALTLVTIDAPPTLSSFAASSSPQASAPITLTVKGSADITLTSIYLDNGDGIFTLASETYLGDATYDSVAKSWKLTLAPGTLTAGSLRLWARAYDGVGYSTARSLSLTVGV